MNRTFRKIISTHDMDQIKLKQEYQRLKKILSVDESNVKALVSFAQLALSIQNYEDAKALLFKFLIKHPNHVPLLFCLGRLYYQTGAFEKALKCFQKVNQLEPKTEGLWLMIADSYYHLNALSQAVRSLKKGLDLRPNQPVLMNRLAFLYKQLGQQKLATGLYMSLTKLPEFAASAHFQLATIMQEQNMPKKSIAHYLHHLKLQPNHADAHYGLGIAYAFMQDFQKAIHSYQEALKYSKDHLQSQMEICAARATICDWSTYDADRETFEQTLEKLTISGKISLVRAAFDINYFNLSPEIHLTTAKRCALQIEQQIEAAGVKPIGASPLHNDKSTMKIKVGYLSPDFRAHAVGRLLFDIFRFHDKEVFEIYAYATIVVQEHDDITEAIKTGCDHFVDCHDWTAFDIAKKISEDGIDILVDLVGYTTYSKPAVMALKPAPIQMHFMGNPDTMGANFTPNFLTDEILVPTESRKYFTEQVVYLRHGWVASPLPSDLPPLTRKDCKLPEDSFVYCSFNFPKKLNPETFNAWMEILKEVPNSVLWIYAPLPLQRDHLKQSASDVGIDPGRIFFAGNVSYTEYLSELSLADVFLDSFHYGAGSTAANALMMGLPLLTLPGKTLVSRLGASVNAAAGMTDWNCKDREEYVNRAIYWGQRPSELKLVKSGLSEKVNNSALCDTEGFISDLEEKYKEMYYAKAKA